MLPMKASFLGSLTFQSQRYYVGLWKVQLPILSFTHYSHAKNWVNPQNDKGLRQLEFGGDILAAKSPKYPHQIPL